MTETPNDLLEGGAALWRSVIEKHDDLDGPQLATLEAACRQRDRADSLAAKAATGDPGALRHEREANLAMTRLLVSLRLPDERGRRPQLRSLRGVQHATATTPPTSLERARARAEGKGA